MDIPSLRLATTSSWLAASAWASIFFGDDQRVRQPEFQKSPAAHTRAASSMYCTSLALVPSGNRLCQYPKRPIHRTGFSMIYLASDVGERVTLNSDLIVPYYLIDS